MTFTFSENMIIKYTIKMKMSLQGGCSCSGVGLWIEKQDLVISFIRSREGIRKERG